MKTLIAITLAAFIEGNTIGVPATVGELRAILFANTYTQHFIPDYLYPGAWWRVKLDVPPDTEAVNLQGLVRLTHGTISPMICEVRLAFRPPGSKDEPDYIMQVIETHRGHGQRTNVTAWVPVVDQHIEVNWTFIGGSPPYPQGCSGGFNLAVGAYVR